MTPCQPPSFNGGLALAGKRSACRHKSVLVRWRTRDPGAQAHTLLEELADATLDGTRKVYLADLAAIPLLIIDDLGMRKLPHTAAEDLLEVIMRRYERASTLLTSNRPVDDWASCSATPPLSPRCLIGCCIMPTCSSAGHAAGGPRSTPTCARRRP
jgi:hypothetical protein